MLNVEIVIGVVTNDKNSKLLKNFAWKQTLLNCKTQISSDEKIHQMKLDKYLCMKKV